jgi:hypothetical protein
MGFTDCFEGVYSLCVLFSYLHYLPETPLPDNLEQFKCFDRQWLILEQCQVNIGGDKDATYTTGLERDL